MTITEEEANLIVSLVAIAENENVAELRHYELAKRLMDHFNIPDENKLIPEIARIHERRRKFAEQLGLK